jgi:hypothetical protein
MGRRFGLWRCHGHGGGEEETAGNDHGGGSVACAIAHTIS